MNAWHTLGRAKKWIIAAAVILLLLTLSISLTAQLRRARAAEHTLAETTLAALTAAAEELQSLNLALDKLGVAASRQQAATMLYQTVLSADRARHSIAALPADNQQLAPLLTYLHEVSKQAGSFLATIASGEAVTDGELSHFAAAQSDVTLLHAELDLARQALLSGSPLAEALPPSAVTRAPTAAELVSYRALPSQEVGGGAALQIAKDFVGIERVTAVAPAPDTGGAAPAFGVTIHTNDLQLNLEVTRRGGKVLLMSPETAGFPALRTPAECTQAASTFLASRGFANMECVWQQVYDGMCVLTFVHVQQGVLIWPDRVVAQVRMDTAEVVGLEARSYWKNHIPRRLAAPTLSADDARAFLSPAVEEQSVRLALLSDGLREKLCWQFTITHNDDTYLSFIDATDGREVLLEKVLPVDAGAISA